MENMANPEGKDWPHPEIPQISPDHIHAMIEDALSRTRKSMYVTTQKDPFTGEFLIQQYGICPESSDATVDDLLFEFTEMGLESMKREAQRMVNELNVSGSEKMEAPNQNRTWQQLGQQMVYAIFHPVSWWHIHKELRKRAREDRETKICKRLEKKAHLKLLQGFIIMAQKKGNILRAEAVQNQD
jgi:hypothetical protein